MKMDSMNNLKNTRTYLVGAMDRVQDGGVQWREKISIPLKEMGVNILDPCKKIIHNLSEELSRQQIDIYKSLKQYSKIRKEFGVIRSADLRCVDISDFIIAHIDTEVHACGTYEEITTANRQKKPVLVWCEQGKRHAPNWLFFMLPHQHIFSSMEDLLKYLKKVNSSKSPETLQRWFFFKEVHK
jgi:hypothetical protein